MKDEYAGSDCHAMLRAMACSRYRAALAFGSGLAAHEQRETFHGFPP
jgi:hypothetical protein